MTLVPHRRRGRVGLECQMSPPVPGAGRLLLDVVDVWGCSPAAGCRRGPGGSSASTEVLQAPSGREKPRRKL